MRHYGFFSYDSDHNELKSLYSSGAIDALTVEIRDAVADELGFYPTEDVRLPVSMIESESVSPSDSENARIALRARGGIRHHHRAGGR